MVIDFYSHVCPRNLMEALRDEYASDESAALFRKPYLYDAEKRIAFMDEVGIDMQVLVMVRPPMWLGMPRDVMYRMLRTAHDGIAAMVEAHPSRFAGVAVAPRVDDTVLEELRRAWDELGLRGVLRASRPRSACLRCNTCDGFPCLVHAKSDAEVIGVRPVLGLENVTLLVGAEVLSLRTDSGGSRVSTVVVSRGGKTEEYSADIVILSAGAANSARILLRSASDQHPNGLANSSDQVGRNYMFHNSTAVAALAKEPNEPVYQKPLGLNDFSLAPDDRPPLGNIQMLGKSNAMAMKGEEPKLTMLAPHWSLEDVARHSVDIWLTTEDLPMPGNRITVDGDGKIHLSYTATNKVQTAGLYEELKTILNKVGMAAHHVYDKNFYMNMAIPLAGVAHQAGTCRFGTDPSTSVANTDCRAHGIDNLYFADASIFPSIGAVNPALTVMANAIRVADHLAERLS